MNEETMDLLNSTVTLTMDDNTEVECAIIATFPAQDKEYIALLPLDENGENEDGEVFIYRFTIDEENNPQLENIEDDEEYEIVSDAFDEWLDAAEFEEECDCGHDHHHHEGCGCNHEHGHHHHEGCGCNHKHE